MRLTTHTNHQADYDAGYSSKVAEISAMGFEAAQRKYALDNPTDNRPGSLAAYYYTVGELEALVDKRPRL